MCLMVLEDLCGNPAPEFRSSLLAARVFWSPGDQGLDFSPISPFRNDLTHFAGHRVSTWMWDVPLLNWSFAMLLGPPEERAAGD